MGSGADTTIRAAKPVDASAIASVHCRSALIAYADIFPAQAPKPSPESLEPGWAQLIEDPGATVLVVGQSIILGCVALRTDPSLPSGWLLSGLYVVPERWGSGLGAALHDAALEVARDHHAHRANLWVLEANARARAMYERRGWRLVAGRKLANEQPGIFDVLYEVVLGT